MYLHEQQRQYIYCIYGCFRENAQWPTYRWVDRELSRIDRKLFIDEIVKDLPDGFANSLQFNRDLNEPAVLSLAAIKECPASEKDLEAFLKAIRYFANVHFDLAADVLDITGEDLISELRSSPIFVPALLIQKIGELLKKETRLYSTSGEYSVDGFHTWKYGITREIRKFDGVESIDDYLELRDNPGSKTIRPSNQLNQLLGYMYRKPGSEDAKTGFEIWSKNLTETNEFTGTKLEVALLNALARLGVPTLFGGDVERAVPGTDKNAHSGPQTPVFDLVALNYGAPMREPTAVLISCKSTKGQPKDIEIRLLSDESEKIRKLLPGWQVFGTLVNLGNPTSDDFQNRNDIRIWTQQDLQVILHARDYKYMAQFLWTPPWHWKRDIENMWWSTYKAHHKDLFPDE